MSERALFVSCAPGLEPMLLDEVRALGAPAAASVAGGVELPGVELLVRANLALGLASSVRLRVARFGAKQFAQLERKAKRVPWAELLPAEGPVRVAVSTRRSRLYHGKAIAERLERVLESALGPDAVAAPDPPEGEPPAVVVRARVEEDVVTLSVDTSGEPLHRRGYRRATGKAPLRADLARALLVCSGWDRRRPLLDPFAGSGTVAIEAALWTQGRAAVGRRFAFERMPGVTRAEPAPAFTEAPPGVIYASDRDAGAVTATRDNAARAGVGEALRVAQAPLSAAPGFQLPELGAVVTNPPYGRRVGSGRDLRSLYQRLGALIRAAGGAPAVALIVADRRLGRATGLPLETAFVTKHGGVPVHGLIGRL